MTCCLLVGTKSGRLKYKKKLFLVSLLAQLVLMNMLKLTALILKNSSFGVNIRASQS